MLGLLAMVAIILICIFRARILESIILSLAVMEEYKFVSPGTTQGGVKAFTLLPLQNGVGFTSPTLPPNWEETFVEQEKHIMFLNTVITSILIAIGLLAIMYTLCKKCWYISSLLRVCFSIYPISNFLRGTARTDIFVEIVNKSMAKSIWAYFATCAVHPSQLRITGYPTAHDMSVIKICCVRQLQVDWQNIILCDVKQHIIKLPVCGHLSVWTTDSLRVNWPTSTISSQSLWMNSGSNSTNHNKGWCNATRTTGLPIVLTCIYLMNYYITFKQ